MPSKPLEMIDRRTFSILDQLGETFGKMVASTWSAPARQSKPPHAESIVQHKKISNKLSRKYRTLVASVIYYEIRRDSDV